MRHLLIAFIINIWIKLYHLYLLDTSLENILSVFVRYFFYYEFFYENKIKGKVTK